MTVSSTARKRRCIKEDTSPFFFEMVALSKGQPPFFLFCCIPAGRVTADSQRCCPASPGTGPSTGRCKGRGSRSPGCTRTCRGRRGGRSGPRQAPRRCEGRRASSGCSPRGRSRPPWCATKRPGRCPGRRACPGRNTRSRGCRAGSR